MIYELFRPLVRVYIVVVILWVWVWMENENIFQCILSSFKYSLSLLTHPHPQLESEFPDWTRLTLLVPLVTRTVQAQPLSSVFPVSYPGSPLSPTVSLEREGVCQHSVTQSACHCENGEQNLKSRFAHHTCHGLIIQTRFEEILVTS